jgi:hypothetical protein
MEKQTKCISVNVTTEQLEQIKMVKEQTGKSQNSVLVESIMDGLKKFEDSDNQLFWVKVRIDPIKMMEFGQKLQSGELKTNMIKFTYCIKDDPTVGISLWEAKNENHFNELFASHKDYYKEVIEVNPAVKAEEAMSLIMKEMS